MQRSPVIFWLLLAATICVDAVAVYWMFATVGRGPTNLFFGLVFGQLSVLCTWVVLLRQRMGLYWLVPFVVGFLAAYCDAAYFTFLQKSIQKVFDWEVLVLATGTVWVHVSIVMAMLWLLKPTRIVAAYSNWGDARPWQFALKHLLVLMTGLAILFAVLRQHPALLDSKISFVTLIAANATVLVAIIAATQVRLHWLRRLALSLTAALIVAGLCAVVVEDKMTNVAAVTLIQAIFIWSWLEQMRPVPRTELTVVVDVPLPE